MVKCDKSVTAMARVDSRGFVVGFENEQLSVSKASQVRSPENA